MVGQRGDPERAADRTTRSACERMPIADFELNRRQPLDRNGEPRCQQDLQQRPEQRHIADVGRGAGKAVILRIADRERLDFGAAGPFQAELEKALAEGPAGVIIDCAGLDYVSCSPFRVPIARLAAAQAALGGPLKTE